MDAPHNAKTGMNRGALISGIVALVAIAVLMMAFLTTASPYVTVAEARTMGGNNLHLPGELVKGSVKHNFKNGSILFALKDENGEGVNVVYTGQAPGSLEDAERIVAIGKLEGDSFIARQLLVKCPTKYQGEKG